jgi:hypothetical protein
MRKLAPLWWIRWVTRVGAVTSGKVPLAEAVLDVLEVLTAPAAELSRAAVWTMIWYCVLMGASVLGVDDQDLDPAVGCVAGQAVLP